jgi:hypothetical protein
MTAPEPGRRHVWVSASGGYRYPGLLMAWRRAPGAGWEAQVAVVRPGSVLVQWVAADALRPVVDDGWARPPER